MLPDAAKTLQRRDAFKEDEDHVEEVQRYWSKTNRPGTSSCGVGIALCVRFTHLLRLYVCVWFVAVALEAVKNAWKHRARQTFGAIAVS